MKKFLAILAILFSPVVVWASVALIQGTDSDGNVHIIQTDKNGNIILSGQPTNTPVATATLPAGTNTPTPLPTATPALSSNRGAFIEFGPYVVPTVMAVTITEAQIGFVPNGISVNYTPASAAVTFGGCYVAGYPSASVAYGFIEGGVPVGSSSITLSTTSGGFQVTAFTTNSLPWGQYEYVVGSVTGGTGHDSVYIDFSK